MDLLRHLQALVELLCFVQLRLEGLLVHSVENFTQDLFIYLPFYLKERILNESLFCESLILRHSRVVLEGRQCYNRISQGLSRIFLHFCLLSIHFCEILYYFFDVLGLFGKLHFVENVPQTLINLHTLESVKSEVFFTKLSV